MRFSALVLTTLLVVSCNSNSNDDFAVFDGEHSKRRIMLMEGFEEQRDNILTKNNMTPRDFIAWSTDSAWSLPANAQTALKNVRTSSPMPTRDVLLQKVIPLEDVSTYMNNVYGGTVGGFVSVAADMKFVSTMYDTFWGLRLDYSGTKFRENGAGYAVIRFYSEATQNLTIPFCPEMGGTQAHAWPNTGGGFTASKLSTGGYPEYTFKGYSAPRHGAELYEVTPEGREILRSRYVEGKGWQTNEIGAPAPSTRSAKEIRNGVYSSTKSGGRIFVTTYATYQGHDYIVRGQVGYHYHLTTQTRYPDVMLDVVEKGIYGISVPVNGVDRVWEDIQNID